MISGVRRRLGLTKVWNRSADLAVLQHHGADLGDGLPVHLEARGLDVKAHELPVQGAVLVAVDHHPVVDVVDEVALHAVEDLDLVPGGVPGVREGLGHAVVRDGDGRDGPSRMALLAPPPSVSVRASILLILVWRCSSTRFSGAVSCRSACSASWMW